ncbi:MAG: hypothetical protein A2Y63_03900 [Candidatus Riflebacteria bacterium RBG_13_59_9]|nr:MAG: hypothetical protein A2Y63_03900 [Candidatus Riflebacteria bacterium RBG_13_59_9]
MELPPVFKTLHCGTAGLPQENVERIDYQAGLARLQESGLSAMELEFVQQVHLDIDGAREVGELAAKRGVYLSAHASYYVNFASLERPKAHASVSRLVKAAKVLHAAGGHSVVFHAAFYQGRSSEEIYPLVAKGIAELETALAKAEVSLWIRPELTGKPTQFGDLTELARLSREFATVLPCIDFSHLHARTAGAYNTTSEWEETLDLLESETPHEKQLLKRMHIHLSGIEYGPKGERKHLALADSDLAFPQLVRVLQRRGVCGTLICEGPREAMIRDAQSIKAIYEASSAAGN